MLRSSLSVVLALALAACGGSAKPSVPPPAPTAPSSVFELGEITLLDGDTAMIKLHADGTTEMGGHKGSMALKPGETASTDSLPVVWSPGPTIKTDGTMIVDGAAVVQVNADGTVTNLKTKEALPLVVTADKVTITNDGKVVSISIGADGALTLVGGTPKPDIHARVTGADTAGKRRAVLAFVALTFASGKVETSSDTSEGHVAAPVPEIKK